MATTVEETKYFEDYLKRTGWGLYYNFMVGFACVCNLIQGVTFVTIPLALSLSTCDKERFIPEKIIIRIFTSYYVGSCFGGLTANFFLDRYGRKRYLTYSLMMLFSSTFAAAFAYNAYVIIGAALVLGVGMETNMTSIRLLTVEILPKERRGFHMIFCSLFWVFGYILPTVVTIALETPTLSNNAAKTLDLGLTTWRIMFAVCGGLNLVIACACALIEESPRYFLSMGRSYLAFLVLKQLYAINKSDFAENFKVKEEEIIHLIPQYGLFYLEPEQYWDIFQKLTWKFCRSVKIIFSKRFYRTTVAVILLKIPVIVVGLLHLNIFLAKQLTVISLSDNSRDKYQGLDFVYPVYKPKSYMSENELEKSTNVCSINKYNTTFFKYYMIVGTAMVPGLLICMFLIDTVGRKLNLFANLLISCCSFLVLRFIEHSAVQLTLVCFIMTSMGSVSAILSLVTLEAYPTAVRGTAGGVTNFMGLFLTVFFINFVAVDYHNFAVIMAMLCSCMSGLTFLLPELKRMPMVE